MAVEVGGPVAREPGERVLSRRVQHDPALLEEEDAIADLERPRWPLLREDDGHAETGGQPDERVRGLGIELGGRLVEQEQLRLEGERGRQADALQLAGGELRDAPLERDARPRAAARAARTRGAISAGGAPTFSTPKATSSSTRPKTTWSSGSWKTVATTPARSAGRVRRVSCPPTSTRPWNRPPWKCGTSPARARTSVDLPEPEGPKTATTSPGSSSSETSWSAGSPAGIGKREAADGR